MQAFECRVKINGYVVHVAIQAKSAFDARRMLEAQYGNSSIQGVNAKR